MEKKNEMKEMLLYCIHIAKHKGVFYTEPEFDKAKEYVNSQLSIDELNCAIDNLDKDYAESDKVKYKAVLKLEKQKELINDV